MAALLLVPFAIGLFIVMAFFFMAIPAAVNGFVLSKMWVWFIMPIFSLPAIGIAQAVGLCFLVSVFKKGYSYEKSPSIKKQWTELAGGIASKLVLLVAAWLLKVWFM